MRPPAFAFKLAGYAQADFRSFRDWQVGDGTDDTQRADEFEWRRLRIGLEGDWRRLFLEFDVDPAFDKGDELKNAWLGLRIARELQLSGGHIKLPVSPEWLTSAGKTDFVERADVVNGLAAARDWGGLVEGEIGKVLEYQSGLFEGDGRSLSNRAGTTVAGRLLLKPTRWLDVGGSYSRGDVTADPSGPGLDPDSKSLYGKSATGYEFFPPVFVDGRRLRWGTEARLATGPVSLWGEFLEGREERRGQGPTLEDLPELRGNGWSVTATWLVTGERKTRTIGPDRSLFAGPGAVEIAVRYEELWFDDVSDEGFESAGSRAANVRPAGLRAFTGGLSWWPSSFVRLMGNVVVERFDDALRAPEPGKEGDYVSVLGRVQVHLPSFRLLGGGEFWLSETPTIHRSKSWDSAFPRMMSYAHLEVRETGQRLWSVVTHLDHISERARIEGAKMIRTWALGRGAAAVLAGDFNDSPGSEVHRVLILPNGPFLDTWERLGRPEDEGSYTQHGFTGVGAKDRIDWILATPEVQVLEASIGRDHEEGRYPSDHYPYWVDLKLVDRPPGPSTVFPASIVVV